MSYAERSKKEIKDDFEGLKEDLFSFENEGFIRIYKEDVLLKSLELEEIKMRIMFLSNN